MVIHHHQGSPDTLSVLHEARDPQNHYPFPLFGSRLLGRSLLFLITALQCVSIHLVLSQFYWQSSDHRQVWPFLTLFYTL